MSLALSSCLGQASVSLGATRMQQTCFIMALKQSPQKWSKHGCAKGTLTVLATGLEKRFQCECTQDYAPLNQVNYSMTERCSYKFARFYCRAIAPYIHHIFTTNSPHIHHIFTTYSPYFHHIFTKTH